MRDVTVLMFASTRYWADEALLADTFARMKAALMPVSSDVTLIVDGDLSRLPEKLADAVIIPLSGAVQQPIIDAALRCDAVALYAGYCSGNFDADIIDRLLYFNAAPTLMDTWGVIKRHKKQAQLAVTRDDLISCVKAMQACRKLRGAKLVHIGHTEPWVISTARYDSVYEDKFGLTVEHVSFEEMIARYEAITAEDAQPMLRYYADHAQKMIESNDEDLINACRFGTALVKLLEDKDAVGGAIACFDLIKRTGASACLGVAYLNDVTDKFLSCEGDMDSAVTMLLLRGLTDGPLWMANPCLDASGLINFSHCTAPWHIGGCECPFIMRRHHESGKSVSLQVDMPVEQDMTLCRISKDAGVMTIHTGTSVPGARKSVCHTQMWVKLDDYAHYLETALGCHQIFAFENITNELTAAAKFLNLNIE